MDEWTNFHIIIIISSSSSSIIIDEAGNAIAGKGMNESLSSMV